MFGLAPGNCLSALGTVGSTALMKGKTLFPLDEFQEKSEAQMLFNPYELEIKKFIGRPKLYILVATKRNWRLN